MTREEKLKRIKELNKAFRQEKWTPVSEGLPKVSDCYVVTRKIGDNLITSACYFEKINAWWYNDNQINHERNCLTNVIAWQPLPEPYEPESEVQDENSN